MSLTIAAQKRLVVDANIAFAASDTSDDECANNCYELLDTIEKCKHSIVLSDELFREWFVRHSNFSLLWLNRMAQARLLCWPSISNNEIIRNAIKEYANNEGEYTHMMKDVHLLEAALFTDKIVASMDKRARRQFVRICLRKEETEIKEIMWVNPDVKEEACCDWLDRGAPVEPERQLGFSVNR